MYFAFLALVLLMPHTAALCSETRDPVACMNKNGCSWCAAASHRGCSRRVGACPKGCSATKSLGELSCPAMPVTRTAASDVSSGITASDSSPGIGIGFSGGGSRAYSCTFGWVRALRDLGLWHANLTVAGVSGAGWFLAPFAYAPANETTLLGEYLAPEHLSARAITTSGGAMAGLPGPIIARCTARLLGVLGTLDGEGLGRIWRDVVDATFLKPLGVVGTRPVVASAAAAINLTRRNPGTFEKSYKPLIPRNASAPTPILLGAVEGPSALAPLARDAPYFPLALGPAWAGVPGARRATYASRRKNRTETVAVGGFVEGWALGAIPLRNSEVALGTAPTGLADALGIASMAPARLFLESLPSIMHPAISAGAGFLNTVPLVRIWAPSVEAAPTTPPLLAVGDGGDLTNTGAPYLLQRGHRRIVLFDCAKTPLNTSWDPRARPPTKTDVDAYLPPLFGLKSKGDKGVEAQTSRNHVFAAEGLPRLILTLQAAAMSGTGAVARVALTTVGNDFHGIEAGRSIDLTLVYLDLPKRWVDALPKETAKAITTRAYRGFPDTPTISDLDLSRSEVSLLAQLCSWVARQHADLLRDALA